MTNIQTLSVHLNQTYPHWLTIPTVGTAGEHRYLLAVLRETLFPSTIFVSKRKSSNTFEFRWWNDESQPPSSQPLLTNEIIHCSPEPSSYSNVNHQILWRFSDETIGFNHRPLPSNEIIQWPSHKCFTPEKCQSSHLGLKRERSVSTAEPVAEEPPSRKKANLIRLSDKRDSHKSSTNTKPTSIPTPWQTRWSVNVLLADSSGPCRQWLSALWTWLSGLHSDYFPLYCARNKPCGGYSDWLIKDSTSFDIASVLWLMMRLKGTWWSTRG